MRGTGSEAGVFVADVSREDQVLQLESDVSSRMGKISILINNAGVNVRKPITELTLEDWRLVSDTNLTGAFLMCRLSCPHERPVWPHPQHDVDDESHLASRPRRLLRNKGGIARD